MIKNSLAKKTISVVGSVVFVLLVIMVTLRQWANKQMKAGSAVC